MSFPEKLQTVFDKYGTTELKIYTLLNLYDDVLDCYAEDQKEHKQKLQQWLKELDKIFDEGYPWNRGDNALETLHKVRESKKKFEELLRSKI